MLDVVGGCGDDDGCDLCQEAWCQWALAIVVTLVFPLPLPPPRGLIDSDICHMVSSDKESSKLSKKDTIASLAVMEYFLLGEKQVDKSTESTKKNENLLLFEMRELTNNAVLLEEFVKVNVAVGQ